MANAKASTTGQITVVSNGTTFYTVIQCQLGDLYQTYLGDVDAPTNIAPDFEASGVTKPVLVFLAYSSEVGSGNGLASIENANMHWFIGLLKSCLIRMEYRKISSVGKLVISQRQRNRLVTLKVALPKFRLYK